MQLRCAPKRATTSGTSGEGSEDQQATKTQQQEPVKLLRHQADEALEAMNNTTLGAIDCMDLAQVESIKRY